MATAEEQDAQFTAGDVERRVAELERKLSLLNESGLDRLTQSGYLQFDGVPIRVDSNGIQIESPGSGDRGAITFVPVFRSGNPATYPYGQLAGYSTDNPSSADEANVTLGAAASSTVNANLFLLGSAFAVGQARFSVNGGGVNAQLKLEVSSSGGYLEVINATLRLDDTTSDPGTLADADMWYRSDTDKFRGRANGATDNFAMEGWATSGFLAATRGNWKVFYSDGSGVFTELALGAAGTFLQSNGASSAPTFAAAGGLAITNQTGTYNAAVSDFVRASGTFTITLPTTPANNSVIAVKNVGSGLVTVARGGSDTIFTMAAAQTSYGIMPGESFSQIYYTSGTEWMVY